MTYYDDNTTINNILSQYIPDDILSKIYNDWLKFDRYMRNKIKKFIIDRNKSIEIIADEIGITRVELFNLINTNEKLNISFESLSKFQIYFSNINNTENDNIFINFKE